MAQKMTEPLPTRSNSPFSVLKEEVKMSSNRKQATAVVEPAVVEETPVVEPTEVVEEAAAEVEQPKTRKCPTHHAFFQDEPEMRPMSDFRFNKTTGKLSSTYCKACQAKRQSVYNKERRADNRGPSANEQLAELQQRLADKDVQLEEAEHSTALLEAEVGRLRALG